MAEVFDWLVIGGGPAGYTGAIRAAQLGGKIGCIEKESQLGGTCLRIGCIPSKALLRSSEIYELAQRGMAQHGIVAKEVQLDLAQMHARKDEVVRGLSQGVAGLFKKHGIAHVRGTARLKGRDAEGNLEVRVQGPEGAEEVYRSKRVLLATGSEEGKLAGVPIDGEWIGTSTHALAYPKVPKHLVVIGAGAIGLELGSVWRRLGAEVTVIEYAGRILPGMDLELAQGAQRLFAKQGLTFRLETKVASARRKGAGCEVVLADGESVACERVLLAVGRRAYTEGLELQAVGLQADPRGRVAVDARFETEAAGVFAVGDLISGPMLAHKAEEDAVACVEGVATGFGHVDYDLVPYVVYTDPEVASVGSSEEALKERGIAYTKGSFPFLANARARAVAEAHGFVKILAATEGDRILGAHILGPHASELIAELAAAMRFGASSEDVARTCHAHPTLAEAIREACLSVAKRTLNI